MSKNALFNTEYIQDQLTLIARKDVQKIAAKNTNIPIILTPNAAFYRQPIYAIQLSNSMTVGSIEYFMVRGDSAYIKSGDMVKIISETGEQFTLNNILGITVINGATNTTININNIIAITKVAETTWVLCTTTMPPETTYFLNMTNPYVLQVSTENAWPIFVENINGNILLQIENDTSMLVNTFNPRRIYFNDNNKFNIFRVYYGAFLIYKNKLIVQHPLDNGYYSAPIDITSGRTLSFTWIDSFQFIYIHDNTDDPSPEVNHVITDNQTITLTGAINVLTVNNNQAGEMPQFLLSEDVSCLIYNNSTQPGQFLCSSDFNYYYYGELNAAVNEDGVYKCMTPSGAFYTEFSNNILNVSNYTSYAMYYNIDYRIEHQSYNFVDGTIYLSPDTIHLTIAAAVNCLDFSRYPFYVGYRLMIDHIYDNTENALVINLPQFINLIYNGTIYTNVVTAVPSIKVIICLETISFNDGIYIILNGEFGALSGNHAVYKHISFDKYSIQDNTASLYYDSVPVITQLPNVNIGTMINIYHMRPVAQSSAHEFQSRSPNQYIFKSPYLYELVYSSDRELYIVSLDIVFTNISSIIYTTQFDHVYWNIDNSALTSIICSRNVNTAESYTVSSDTGQLIFLKRPNTLILPTAIGSTYINVLSNNISSFEPTIIRVDSASSFKYTVDGGGHIYTTGGSDINELLVVLKSVDQIRILNINGESVYSFNIIQLPGYNIINSTTPYVINNAGNNHQFLVVPEYLQIIDSPFNTFANVVFNGLQSLSTVGIKNTLPYDIVVDNVLVTAGSSFVISLHNFISISRDNTTESYIINSHFTPRVNPPVALYSSHQAVTFTDNHSDDITALADSQIFPRYTINMQIDSGGEIAVPQCTPTFNWIPLRLINMGSYYVLRFASNLGAVRYSFTPSSGALTFIDPVSQDDDTLFVGYNMLFNNMYYSENTFTIDSNITYNTLSGTDGTIDIVSLTTDDDYVFNIQDGADRATNVKFTNDVTSVSFIPSGIPSINGINFENNTSFIIRKTPNTNDHIIDLSGAVLYPKYYITNGADSIINVMPDANDIWFVSKPDTVILSATNKSIGVHSEFTSLQTAGFRLPNSFGMTLGAFMLTKNGATPDDIIYYIIDIASIRTIMLASNLVNTVSIEYAPFVVASYNNAITITEETPAALLVNELNITIYYDFRNKIIDHRQITFTDITAADSPITKTIGFESNNPYNIMTLYGMAPAVIPVYYSSITEKYSNSVEYSSYSGRPVVYNLVSALMMGGIPLINITTAETATVPTADTSLYYGVNGIYYTIGDIFELEVSPEISFIHGSASLLLPPYDTANPNNMYTIQPSTQNFILNTATFTLYSAVNFTGDNLEIQYDAGVAPYTGLTFTVSGNEYVMGPIEFSHSFAFIYADTKLIIHIISQSVPIPPLP